jgi:hypothetical protein
MFRLRVRARAIAMALLVSLGTLTASTAVPHEDDCHGSMCAPFAAAHDPSQHSLEAAPFAPDDHTLHCVMCHWTRLLRPPAEAVQQPARAASAAVRLPIDGDSLPRACTSAQPPLRSPPPAPLA